MEKRTEVKIRSVKKVMPFSDVHDLHDVGGVLDDGYFWIEIHLGSTVEKAVRWDTCF